ncbi:hypothetical protein O6H91_04G043700 [Diphasiastrum complanatum]|uniref:Uncharacterized protein n=1 Tax=Diphasiastrum complanatum TaxID=34168 RepID=A0ACC2DW55_DIPCM|nr:hypothetical protein O6H91_04G043700 [Diphasiastrum complanatum]
MDPLSLIAFLPPSPPLHAEIEEEEYENSMMDERVWSRLPEEVLERILAAMPVPSILRLRSVCKAWNSLLASKKFTDFWLQHFKSRTPCYLMPAFLIRDTLTLLMPEFSWGEAQNLRNLTPSAAELVASDGGLLLFRFGSLRMPQVYVVCNPMTGKWKCLPRIVQTTGRHSFIGIGTDSASNTYKVVISGNQSDASDLTTKVYGSSTDSWMGCDSALPHGSHQSGVVCNGNLYLVGKDPAKVVAFDFQLGVWTEIQPPIPDRIIRPYLFERHGQLMIVGGVDNIWTRTRLPNPESIGLWKLDQALKAWVEVERLPKLLCEEFRKWINFDSFRCIGQHDILYLTCTNHGRDVMAYDISNRTWKWLPESPRLVDYHGRPRWRPLPFEPSPFASL